MERVETGKMPSLPDAPELHLESDSFEDGLAIPRRHSKEGENLSPPLSWEEVPQGTVEIMIVCEDPDAPAEEPFVHWVISGISPETHSLAEGVEAVRRPSEPRGAVQHLNSGGTIGYMGPNPPRGKGLHHYHFQIFALSQRATLPERPARRDIAKVIARHSIAVGELIGTYRRS